MTHLYDLHHPDDKLEVGSQAIDSPLNMKADLALVSPLASSCGGAGFALVVEEEEGLDKVAVGAEEDGWMLMMKIMMVVMFAGQ